jgi:hypothetical protein
VLRFVLVGTAARIGGRRFMVTLVTELGSVQTRQVRQDGFLVQCAADRNTQWLGRRGVLCGVAERRGQRFGEEVGVLLIFRFSEPKPELRFRPGTSSTVA